LAPVAPFEVNEKRHRLVARLACMLHLRYAAGAFAGRGIGLVSVFCFGNSAPLGVANKAGEVVGSGRLPAGSQRISKQDQPLRAIGITVYLTNGGLLEHAQQMAAHESARTTKLYDPSWAGSGNGSLWGRFTAPA
jgi:hypothetical protein